MYPPFQAPIDGMVTYASPSVRSSSSLAGARRGDVQVHGQTRLADAQRRKKLLLENLARMNQVSVAHSQRKSNIKILRVVYYLWRNMSSEHILFCAQLRKMVWDGRAVSRSGGRRASRLRSGA